MNLNSIRTSAKALIAVEDLITVSSALFLALLVASSSALDREDTGSHSNSTINLGVACCCASSLSK